MKKVLLPLFSFLLVLGLLGTSFISAKAAPGDDPVVTPVSGDIEFTTEVVPIASLPGTTVLESQMLVPVGFPAGETQFEGAGVRITGMDIGKATACFAVSGMQFGWGGKVGLWDGTKWVLLPTTITTAEEALNSLACASVSGNGTYTFIKYVVDPSLLAKCNYDTSAWSGGFFGDGHYFYARVNSLPAGTVVTYTVIVPDFNLFVAPTGNTIAYGPPGFIYADFGDNPLVWEEPWTQVTLRISALGCSKDIVYRFVQYN